MNVAHEDVGNNVWREAVDDLVEEVRSIGKGISSVPAYRVQGRQ